MLNRFFPFVLFENKNVVRYTFVRCELQSWAIYIYISILLCQLKLKHILYILHIRTQRCGCSLLRVFGKGSIINSRLCIKTIRNKYLRAKRNTRVPWNTSQNHRKTEIDFKADYIFCEHVKKTVFSVPTGKTSGTKKKKKYL